MLIGEYVPSDRIYMHWTRRHRTAHGAATPFAPRAVHFIAGWKPWRWPAERLLRSHAGAPSELHTLYAKWWRHARLHCPALARRADRSDSALSAAPPRTRHEAQRPRGTMPRSWNGPSKKAAALTGRTRPAAARANGREVCTYVGKRYFC